VSEARDIAWREYSKMLDPITRDHIVAKNAFVAGWEARKRISMLGHVRPGYDPATGRKLPTNKPPEPGT